MGKLATISSPRLPDAMEGPTLVSALIHAQQWLRQVFLVCRISPILAHRNSVVITVLEQPLHFCN